jgi:Uncharacterised nucleotidyltransferase
MANRFRAAESWYEIYSKSIEWKLQTVFGVFRREGVEPVLIKGWAIGRLYPKCAPRTSTDMDICVASEDYEKAALLYRSPELGSCNIDLHRELRTLDFRDWDDLVRSSETIDVKGTSVRVLCAEDHLRVLCTHWLMDGGAVKNRLWDIYYLIQSRSSNFDWDRCLNNAPDRYRSYIFAVLKLTERFIGLELADAPIEFHETHLPRWLNKAIDSEWRANTKLQPLLRSLGDKRQFWAQIKKRIPPNPIQATIEESGQIDSGSRLGIQVKNFVNRSHALVRRILQ